MAWTVVKQFGLRPAGKSSAVYAFMQEMSVVKLSARTPLCITPSLDRPRRICIHMYVRDRTRGTMCTHNPCFRAPTHTY